MKLKLYMVFLLLVPFASGCFLFGLGTGKNPEQELFDEIMTAYNNRAYESSIKACEEFLAKYQRSKVKESVMMRMGECFEGLVNRDYHELISKGMEEKKARDSFLAKHGSYHCWELRDEQLRYNKEMFQKLLKENPQSVYADEAMYNLISWETNYKEDTEQVEKEIKDLNGVLTQYPTTSLRPKIYFQMGYRFQILYEIYSFAKNQSKRDKTKAQESFRHAEDLYNLCLNSPEESEYSQKALRYLDLLRNQSRIYIK
jgi:outer membrane protein assembly factor BamD (BamD/ComL family)